MGHQLLQALLCHMVQKIEEECVEKRWAMLFLSPTCLREEIINHDSFTFVVDCVQLKGQCIKFGLIYDFYCP